MKLAAGPGARTRHYKGTFGCYPHETYGPPALGQDKWGRTVPLPERQRARAESAPSKRREVDLRGAPATLHRGVTSLRARTLATGTQGSCVPVGNLSMSYNKELEWHPCAYTNGSLMVHEHPRNMFEGLAGVKTKAGKIHAIHAHAPFAKGAHQSHHALFDPTVRGISADHTFDPYAAHAAQLAHSRIPHRVPFVSGGGAPRGVGADKSFLGGHAQFPYHYSEYSLSEKSLSETSTNASTGPGFRMQCAHQLHFPMRATTARPSKRGGETNRDSNLHAIQAHDERCNHRCNEVLAAAASTAQGSTIAAGGGQPPNPNNVASNGAPVRFTARF